MVKKRNCVFHVLMLDALILEEYQIGCKQKTCVVESLVPWCHREETKADNGISLAEQERRTCS